MPRKKRANVALITDPTKTQYMGFVDDVNDLFEVAKDMHLDTRIDEILVPLNAMIDSIQIPPRAKADVKKNLQDKKAALTALVSQLEAIKGNVSVFVSQESLSYSHLNRALKWKNDDPLKDPDKIYEGYYKEHLDTLRVYPKDIKKVFTGEGEGGIPVNIRENLDNYNKLTGYAEYANEDSVLLKVDELFNDVTKLFTKSARITTLSNRYSAIKEIESNINYDQKNLEEYGKSCFYDKNFSMSNLFADYLDKSDKKSVAQRERDAAKSAMEKARLDQIKLQNDYQELIRSNEVDEETKQRTIAEYNEKKAIYDKILNIRKAIEEGNKKFPYPDITGLKNAYTAEYKSFDDYMKTCTLGMNDLKKQEEDTQDKLDKNNSAVQKTKKLFNNDEKLEGFYKKESEKVQYQLYPAYCRKFVSYIRSLPEEYRLSFQTLNVIKLKIDIDAKLKEKKGRPEVWYNLKAMLNTIHRLCPGEYITLPLDEQYIKRCEDEGKTKIDEFEKSELYKKVDQYRLATREKKRVEAEIKRLKEEEKNHDRKSKSKKEKDFFRDHDADLKARNAELKRINESIALIENDGNYIKGAGELKELMDQSFLLYQGAFAFNETQTQIYSTLLADAKKNKEKHWEAEKAEMMKIYNQMVQRYNLLPDYTYASKNHPNRTKEKMPIKQALDDMRYAENMEAFVKSYRAFQDEILQLNKDFSKDDVQRVGKRIDELKKNMDETAFREETIKNYEEQIKVATADYNAKVDDYNKKNNALAVSIQNETSAYNNVRNNGKYYERKWKGETFDAHNEKQDDYKNAIDQKGDNFFTYIRQPFMSFYARREYCTSRWHSNSGEFNRMIEDLSAIVTCDTGISVKEYKKLLKKLKTKTETYINAKLTQRFQSSKSTIRKYRLGFARGILALCDDQLDTLDGTERIAELSDGVKNYLNRTEAVEVNAINEEEKRAYNKSLDDRRKEAIKAYKNSAEYSIIQQLQDEKLQDQVEKLENDLKDAEETRKKGDENEIASYKRHRNIFANKSMDDVIDDIKIRKAELIKNYQKQKMLKMIDDDNLDDEGKAKLQGLLKDLDENKIYYNDQRIDAPERKVPEIKQNNIIPKNTNMDKIE